MKESKGNKGRCNKFKINRAKHKSHFTCITNYLIKDERLNSTEIGLMAIVLSNDDTKYILNSSFLQQKSGLGKDAFYKSWKKLQKLGYVNKYPFQGGIHWEINEIPSNKANSKNFTIPESRSTESTSTENTTTENSNTESTNIENTTLINNKASAESGKPLPPDEEAINEKSNNHKVQKIENSPFEWVDEELLNDFPDNHTPNNNTPINDLQFLIDNSPTFKYVYEGSIGKGSNWHGIEINTYSNDKIAFIVGQRVKNEDLHDTPMNAVKMFTMMVKFSGKFPNESKLWQLFLKEIDNHQAYIDKLSEF